LRLFEIGLPAADPLAEPELDTELDGPAEDAEGDVVAAVPPDGAPPDGVPPDFVPPDFCPPVPLSPVETAPLPVGMHSWYWAIPATSPGPQLPVEAAPAGPDVAATTSAPKRTRAKLRDAERRRRSRFSLDDVVFIRIGRLTPLSRRASDYTSLLKHFSSRIVLANVRARESLA
jgi:hypothetical protein